MLPYSDSLSATFPRKCESEPPARQSLLAKSQDVIVSIQQHEQEEWYSTNTVHRKISQDLHHKIVSGQREKISAMSSSRTEGAPGRV